MNKQFKNILKGFQNHFYCVVKYSIGQPANKQLSVRLESRSWDQMHKCYVRTKTCICHFNTEIGIYKKALQMCVPPCILYSMCTQFVASGQRRPEFVRHYFWNKWFIMPVALQRSIYFIFSSTCGSLAWIVHADVLPGLMPKITPLFLNFIQGPNLRADWVDSSSHFLPLNMFSVVSDPTSERAKQNICPVSNLLNLHLNFTQSEISFLPCWCLHHVKRMNDQQLRFYMEIS